MAKKKSTKKPVKSKTATKAKIKADIAKVMKKHDKDSMTRNFYVANGAYTYEQIYSLFGTWAEVMIYCELKPSRVNKALLNSIAKHSTLDEMRDYYHAEIKPFSQTFVRKSKKTGIETAVIGSDFHDIDTCPFAMEVFLDTIKRYQPEYVILNGDIFDEYEFSRFDKDPRKCDVAKRFNFVKEQIFKRVREAAPDAQIDLIIGNHEIRILTLLSGQQPHLKVLLGDVMGLRLKDIFGLDDYGINLITKFDLAVWTRAEEKEIAKQNFKVYNEFYVAAHDKDHGFAIPGTSGHTHRPSIITKANIPSGTYTWMTTPAMSLPDAEYMAGMDKASSGFGVTHMDITNKNAQQNLFITTDGFLEIGGKFYFRK